ncbi:hypothetical protein NM688_g2512 [Phlebia brevispora]|uniref:Uncharacterized protein n=1 Tax=Phlebia brevispora TaxID=194682 RepID=A0ACC1T8R7_9APHY|nr:hypothetical protein NM688_g2512 [Phlebia brevispora]
MAQQKFPFNPIPWSTTDDQAPEALKSDNVTWAPLIRCPAVFPVQLFETAISQLVHHPEYNSTLILRSEMVSESIDESQISPIVPTIQGFTARWSIRRRLLPRRPGRDAALEQHCTLYGHTNTESSEEMSPSILVLTPIVDLGSSLPYYHPRVSHLAFRYVVSSVPMLQIEVVPLPETPVDLNSRLYRTCLALLETLHRYGWGAMIHYKKRVIHDCIVPREPYQDLYLVMRERHKHLVNEWHEVTDPLKHVFEDIGIATFLMLLWNDIYASHEAETELSPVTSEGEPWRNWSRPPAGFVDMGCGNGLLTHILVSEGYGGHGLDLRARTSWAHYPETTQSHLHVEALDPTVLEDLEASHRYLKPGVFLIGNHADELTPWIPVLSTLCSASGYLSIPCCSWTFDMRYERSKCTPYPVPTPYDEFVDGLNLGGDGSNTSAYSMYRIWLASLSHHCGWKVESETLRIPSTRNWALVGRVQTWKDDEDAQTSRENVKAIIDNVKGRGIFKTRTPEGKASEH